jgi:enterochelin esterase-like enzyme
MWFVELTVPRDVLATYRFLPLSADGNEPEQVPSPRELLRRARVDHHNPTASEGSPFGSILAGPDAPEIDVWTAPASSSSTVIDRTIDLGWSPLRYRLVVPPGGGPLHLLVVFDADRWVDEYRLPDVLSAAGLRYAVLGVDSPADPGARLRFLGAHDELFAAVADEAVPAVRRRISGPHRVVIAGQSLGGLAALSFTARHPDLVDEVLAYSPSVWWRPGLATRPADVTAHQEWIHDQIVACAPGAFTIRLASGAFEDELTPGVAALATTARRAGHAVEHTVYSGGHDEAHWATMLLTHLRNPS